MHFEQTLLDHSDNSEDFPSTDQNLPWWGIRRNIMRQLREDIPNVSCSCCFLRRHLYARFWRTHKDASAQIYTREVRGGMRWPLSIILICHAGHTCCTCCTCCTIQWMWQGHAQFWVRCFLLASCKELTQTQIWCKTYVWLYCTALQLNVSS